MAKRRGDGSGLRVLSNDQYLAEYGFRGRMRMIAWDIRSRQLGMAWRDLKRRRRRSP